MGVLEGAADEEGGGFAGEAAVTGPQAWAAELGSREADGTDFLGVYRTKLRGDRLLGTVSGTLDARDDERFSLDLLVIQYDGMGGLVCLDLGDLDAEWRGAGGRVGPGCRGPRWAGAAGGRLRRLRAADVPTGT